MSSLAKKVLEKLQETVVAIDNEPRVDPIEAAHKFTQHSTEAARHSAEKGPNYKKELAYHNERMRYYKQFLGDSKLQNNVESLEEGKMAQLHADISNELDRHIADYKRVGGADALGRKSSQTATKIAALHGLKPEHATKFVNDYVSSKLKEETIAMRPTIELAVEEISKVKKDK